MTTGGKMTSERKVLELIATDRLHIPISSISGKLKRREPKLAQQLGLTEGKPFHGERAYARVETEDRMKARGMAEGIAKFAGEFPRYGTILKGYIEEQRANSETHVYFGMNEGCRLTQVDYLGVMTNLGFTESSAMALYAPLMEASRNISRKREEAERSVLIG